MQRIRVGGERTARRGDTGNLPVAVMKDSAARRKRGAAPDEYGTTARLSEPA
ncbi:hypothetical protein ACFFRL_11035 [Agromyces hippuratus]|uniref:hypothetical protein n=1 Tax=Agromyces hippuratus TaxID=286438 RepID=UPI000B232468